MGESAKILNPNKKVLMPNNDADCAMAHMVKDGIIEQLKQQYEDLAVVCYINSTAALKCQSDVCVTSSNAVKIVKALPNKNIFFIPDKHLGSFVAKQVPEKNIILNDGYCPIHAQINQNQVEAIKMAHPNALVLTHPECNERIVNISDFIGSTSEIMSYAKNSDALEYIICTEDGVNYQLMKDNPNKHFYISDFIGSTSEIMSYAKNSDALEYIICTEDGVNYQLMKDNPNKHFYYPNPRPCCLDMKLNTLESIYDVLLHENNEVIVDESIAQKALLPLKKMLENPRPCCLDMKLNTLESIYDVLLHENNEVIVDESIAQKALLPLKKMLELGK